MSLSPHLIPNARSALQVCTTIHQPNSLIVGKFDDFMLLSGGACVYYGVWAGAVDFFAANGFPCPQASALQECRGWSGGGACS